jgi:tRNA(adenine34) deaminase
MQQAYKQALLAYEAEEIPVGAVVICQNRVIARAYNQTEKLHDVTAHAEMLAITAAANYLHAKYLTGCTLYVTLEPCVMCAGALAWSQLERVVYGAADTKRGFSLLPAQILHPRTKVTTGIMGTESEALLKQFFRKLRN